MRPSEETEAVPKRLRRELDGLQKRLNIREQLEVTWAPGLKTDLSGEVKGHTIFLYDSDPSKALETLRHEVVDYVVSQAIEPYKEIANESIRYLNRVAYAKKEEAVEKLRRLLD